MDKPTICDPNDPSLVKWQLRLLPLMKGMVIWLTFFFFVTSFAQLIYLHFKIEKSSPIFIEKFLLTPSANESFSFQERLRAKQFNATIMLESNTIERRHQVRYGSSGSCITSFPFFN
jgi:hypothetical protein